MRYIFSILFFLLSFCYSCINSDQPTAQASISDSADFHQRMTLLKKTYADPNSPYRNEARALEIYDSILGSPYYSSAEKTVVQKNRELLLQNRVGQQANDFVYYDPANAAKRLYDLKAPFLLLYFYNPECNACKEMKTALTSSAIISQNIRSRKLKVLAIYPDPGIELWKRHLPEMPEEWVHGRDDQEYLWKNKVYDLRAIPTLYLLDKDKKVLLKDVMDLKAIEAVIK